MYIYIYIYIYKYELHDNISRAEIEEEKPKYPRIPHTDVDAMLIVKLYTFPLLKI